VPARRGARGPGRRAAAELLGIARLTAIGTSRLTRSLSVAKARRLTERRRVARSATGETEKTSS